MPTNALSVDVEEYFQVSNFEHCLRRGEWNDQPSRVQDSTQRLLDLFDATESRATFFVLGWIAERHPELVREIAERGHEIACHGYHHELVYAIGPDRFRADLQRAVARIGEASGVRPRGYRAPSYSITRASLWALDILAEEGFQYDSSIFPVHHHRYGIPGFSRRPLRLWTAAGNEIQEFPMTTLRLGPLTLPMAGGAYLRFMPERFFRWGFGSLVKAGEPTVLYLHPWEIDAGQPRQDVGLRVRVNHYHNLHRTETRLRNLLETFSFAPMADVLHTLEEAGQLQDHVMSPHEEREVAHGAIPA